jgi:hypothetical protein
MNNYIIDSKQINLSSNSSILNNGSLKSVMTFSTNSILKKEKDILYNLISVVHCEIPVSYYIINETNNYLSLSTGNYTLLNGNYNASSFKSMLLSLIGTNFTIILDTATGKYTITHSSSDFTIYPSSTCYKLMGFIQNTTYTSIAFSITMPYPCNFLGISRIKIKSNVLKTDNIDTYSGGKSNLLTTIPVNSASYGLILYQNLVGFKNIIPNITVDYIDITLTDENDNIINFNGIDNYITLQLDTIRLQKNDETNLLELLESENNKK